jgi:hypothetical protein
VPELPDVEGFRRVFAAHAVQRPIRRVDVLAPACCGMSARTGWRGRCAVAGSDPHGGTENG